MPRPASPSKVFRDPIHDIINYKDEPRLGGIVCDLIDTAEVQRLRFVRQLGLASLVFHGAEHSRFAHCMGVAHIARRICDRFVGELDDDQRIATVAAALLHDLGHAPFSHVLERVFGFHHEELSAAILTNPESEAHRVLAAIDPAMPGQVVALIRGEPRGVARDIVSSQLDADRFDYLLRDAHMTGAAVGRFDLERILLMLRYDDEGMLVDVRAYEAVEGYLVARYHMYRLIYFHRAVRCAETMLERAFARARWLARQGDARVLPRGPFGRWIAGEAQLGSDVAQVTDFDAWALLAQWREHPDRVLSSLATGVLTRRLFKANERNNVAIGADEAADREVEQRILEELSPDERFLFAVDVARDHPYLPYMGAATDASPAIRVIDGAGRVRHIEALSPIVRALGDASYRMRRWVYDPRLEDKLRRIAGDAWEATRV